MQNDMRNRLANLIYEAERKVNNEYPTIEMVAEHLIANGVIVLPCKVGDTVYLVRDKCTCNKAVCIENGGIGITRCKTEPCDVHIREVPFSLYLFNALGKTVFLTKEEAKAKLKEVEQE